MNSRAAKTLNKFARHLGIPLKDLKKAFAKIPKPKRHEKLEAYQHLCTIPMGELDMDAVNKALS